MVSKLSQTRANKRPSSALLAAAAEARHHPRRLLELAVLVGIGLSCIFMIQSVSPVIHSTLAGKTSDTTELATLVNKLTSTIESYESNIKNMQNRLDKMQSSLDNVIALSSGVQPTTTALPATTAQIPPPEANDNIEPLVRLLTQKQTDGTNMPQKILYYNLGRGIAGFGSLFNNMLYVASYLRISQGRQLVVDESDLTLYRKDYSHGMISGYFDTTFPVISTKCHCETIKIQTGIDFNAVPLYNTEKSDSNHPVIRVNTHDSNSFNKARREARNFYSHPTPQTAPGKIHQFYTLTTEYCNSISINKATQRAIQEILQKASMPDFAELALAAAEESGDGGTTSLSSSPPPITVAMHVRRGDKNEEVRHSPAAKYVQKLEKALTDNRMDTTQQLQALQHVFVATDDYAAFLEVQREMAKSVIVKHAKLHTLASPAGHKRDGDDFTLLLAEMKMMIDATFFIGTYTSNIGTAITFFRGCNHPAVKNKGLPPIGQEYKILTNDQVSNRLDHYYQSYGIEGDEWFMFPTR